MNPPERKQLLHALRLRFEAHLQRHPGLAWSEVQARLDARPEALRSLLEMECTGGEPDVVAFDGPAGRITFCDCAAQSPAGRRSLCYDQAALDARKQNKPQGSAVAMAAAMGIALLSEAQYRTLQRFGEFDTKTSSWVHTPAPMRALDGALFCDRRYEQVFVYHNGAQSYYASRGFRGALQL